MRRDVILSSLLQPADPFSTLNMHPVSYHKILEKLMFDQIDREGKAHSPHDPLGYDKRALFPF